MSIKEAHPATFPHSLNNSAKSLFHLVHSDIWNPSRVSSTLGFKYVTFNDDYSKHLTPNVEPTLLGPQISE